MVSSISSSRQAPLRLRWGVLLLSVLLPMLAYVTASEYMLKAKGFPATWRDSMENWVFHRALASALGERALILVGASRIQLGMDLPSLRRMTGLEPVMLAIDGSSVGPILAGLAKDPDIRGTVIIDVMPAPIVSFGAEGGVSQQYQSAYERRESDSDLASPSEALEARLTQEFRNQLANYSDAARPWDVLRTRLLDPDATPQYLQTLPDRSRVADYGAVEMPKFYLRRVMRHLGEPLPLDERLSDLEQERALTGYIRQLGPVDRDGQSLKGLSDFEAAVTEIQARGGKVLLLTMPTSGLVSEIDERRYPRHLYWDRLVAATSAQTLHWQDHPELSGFDCPDGSHLDRRDRVRFTEAVVRVAGLERR